MCKFALSRYSAHRIQIISKQVTEKLLNKNSIFVSRDYPGVENKLFSKGIFREKDEDEYGGDKRSPPHLLLIRLLLMSEV